MAAADVTFDLGCGWLHSANQNSFVKIAEQLNFEIDKNAAAVAGARLRQRISESRARRVHPGARGIYDRAEQAAEMVRKAGRDSAANLYLEPGNRWNPMIDAISTYMNGCELDQVSLLDMDAYEDTNINWRVRRGYGALVAAYGASCPLAYDCEVADRSLRKSAFASRPRRAR